MAILVFLFCLFRFYYVLGSISDANGTQKFRSVTEWIIFVWFMELLELDTDKCK